MSSKSRLLAAALACGVLATLLPSAAPGVLPLGAAQAQAAECTDGWRELDLPIVENDYQYLLAAVSDEEGPRWLLGGSFATGRMAYRKDADGWTRVENAVENLAGLSGGALITPSRIALSGFRNQPPVGTTARVSGDAFALDETHREVAALSDVARTAKGTWVVGTRHVNDLPVAAALRRIGKSWHALDPARSGTESAFTAVDATPAGKVWAVGWVQPAGTWRRPLIMRHTGSGWKQVSPARLPRGEAVLTDVHFPTNDRGWASGYRLPRGRADYRAVLMRWSAGRWRETSLPFAKGRNLIASAVASDGQGRLFLAGVELASPGRERRGFVATRYRGSWSYRVLDTPGGLVSELRGLSASAKGVVAVGLVSGTAFAMESCTASITGSDRTVDVSRIPKRKRAPAYPPTRLEEAERGATPLSLATAEPPAFGVPRAAGDWYVTDVAADYGLPDRTSTWSGFIRDMDGNGWKDIFYGRHGSLPHLWLAGPSGLTESLGAGFSDIDRHGCAAADIDGNGLADVYCATGRGRGITLGRNEFTMNVAGASPRLVRGALGAVDPTGRGRLATFIDFDDDGDKDLLVTAGNARVDGFPPSGRFFRNVGGRFVPYPEAGLDRSVRGVCLWSGDLDQDRDEDLLICEGAPADERKPGLRIYRNGQHGLAERSRQLGVWPMGDIDVAVADVTGDKRRDLIQLSPGRLRVSKRTDKGFRTIFEARTSDAVAVAAGDINGDGRAEIYVLRGGRKQNKRDYLLLNQRHGKGFVPIVIPQTSEGSADDVLAIDFDRNGRTDFVVLNGRYEPGPVQLLAAFPR